MYEEKKANTRPFIVDSFVVSGGGGNDDVSTLRTRASLSICFLLCRYRPTANATVFRCPEQALLCNSYHILICLQLYFSRALLPFGCFDCTKLCLFTLHICLQSYYYLRAANTNARRRIFTLPNMTLCVRAALCILHNSLRYFHFTLCSGITITVCNARCQSPDRSDKFHLCRLKHWLLAENIYAFSFSSQNSQGFSPFLCICRRCDRWHRLNGVKATRTAASGSTKPIQNF